MKQRKPPLSRTLPTLALITLSAVAESADWPMWRRDAARRASSAEELAEELHLQWVLELPEPRPAWPSDQKKLQFDALYEPILAGSSLFVGSMVADKVTAYDTRTGGERWRFYTEGPVRFAPAYREGRLYVGSDDGYLYCLDADSGRLLWRYRGGPSDRKLIGNERVISAWPVRGAPVVYDGKVYFGASIWPFMGVFIHALDAETGGTVWTNSGSGSDYLVQQHNSPAFAGVAPQGYMAATEERLVVSGGRTVPAVYDRKTGDRIHFNVASRRMGRRGGGGYGVYLSDDFYLNSGQMYRLDNGRFILDVEAPVFTDHVMIAADDRGRIIGYRHEWREVEFTDRRGKKHKRTIVPELWRAALEKKVSRLFLMSGSRLYGVGEEGEILAVDLPRFDRGSRISWSTRIPGQPLNMISGDDRLFVTTGDGRIYCFGETPTDAKLPEPSTITFVPKEAEWRYLDDGKEPPAAWKDPGYDASGWASGPARLGYGEDGIATEISFGGDDKKKHIAYYFRHEFVVPPELDHGAGRIEVLVDDGAVIYLNGTEVGRVFMPDGEIRHDTEARSGTDEKTYQELSVPRELFQDGRNLLAVEVHQGGPGSSDVIFDLALTSEEAREPRITPAGDRWSALASRVLEASAADGGYCLALGLGSGRLVEELAALSDLHVVVVEPDAEKVRAFRRRVDERGNYGTRLAAIVADPAALEISPYLATLVVAEDPRAAGITDGEAFVRRVFHVLRPYGGTAVLACDAGEHEELAAAVGDAALDGGRLERAGELSLLRRVRPPAGAGEWTHQYADASNSVVSDEELVRAPLGLLWFGGPSNEDVLPRHGHGPTPQVVGGRLFIEGPDVMRAIDIYTGRLLWQRKIEDVGKWYDYTSHEPGANAIGSNYVSLSDGVYVRHEKVCLRLDPATGETLSEFRLPPSGEDEERPDWGHIAIDGRYLVAGSQPVAHNPAHYTDRELLAIKGEMLGKAVGVVKSWIGFEPAEVEEDEEETDGGSGDDDIDSSEGDEVGNESGGDGSGETDGGEADSSAGNDPQDTGGERNRDAAGKGSRDHGDEGRGEASNEGGADEGKSSAEDKRSDEKADGKADEKADEERKREEEERKKKEEEERKKKEEEERKKQEKSDRIFVLLNVNKLLLSEDMLSKIPESAWARFDKEEKDKKKEEERKKRKKKLEELTKKLEDYFSAVPGRRGTDHEALVIKREILEHLYGLPRYESKPPGKFGSEILTSSKKLVGLDRHTGEVLWEHEARHVARHNAIALGGGKVFFIDRLSDLMRSFYKRRGLDPDEDARVAALDIRTGELLWENRERVFGTWLGYSEEHDVLLQAGSRGRDRARDEVGEGMVAYRGATGEVLWQNDEKYSGPCLLLDDRLITQGYDSPGVAFDLLTGEPIRARHPISGDWVRWQYTRNYGCNTAIGCRNLLTFRSAAAGYYDLSGNGGTGNFGGFRSGCTSNLIPAGGIITAPDYTRTCTCAYQNQSSLALVHMPEAEMWTFNRLDSSSSVPSRAGINFGAPGDRRGPEGVLWLDYPSVGGSSPDLPVELFAENVRYPRYHSSYVSGPLPWVASSALEGAGELLIELVPRRDLTVPDEVGTRPLVSERSRLSAKVPVRSIAGMRNLTSLRKAPEKDALDAKIERCEMLASPSVTVEFWVRTDKDLHYVDTRPGGRKKEQGFVIDNRELRARYFVAKEDGENNDKQVEIKAKDKIEDNRWVHVAFTYDRASGEGRLYRDGKVVARHDGPDGRPLWWDVEAPDLALGADANDDTWFDELRIARRALAPEELLVHPGSKVPHEDLVGHWRMESESSRAKDGDEAGGIYSLSFIFSEIEDAPPGARIFDVLVQGEDFLWEFDIAREAGGSRRAIIRETGDVRVEDYLRVSLVPRGERPPLLGGILIQKKRDLAEAGEDVAPAPPEASPAGDG